MLVEIRIYRRHDADLMMLKSYGANISRLMHMALDNFAEGRRIKIKLPDAHPHSLEGITMLRYRLDIQNPEVIKKLRQIKKGYRNQFCKALLRDMLECEPLGVYMETPLIEKENERVISEAGMMDKNLSEMFEKKKGKKKKDINGETDKKENKNIETKEEIKETKEKIKEKKEEIKNKNIYTDIKKEEKETAFPTLKEKEDVKNKKEIKKENISQEWQPINVGGFGQEDDENLEEEEKEDRRNASLFAMFEDMRFDAE